VGGVIASVYPGIIMYQVSFMTCNILRRGPNVEEDLLDCNIDTPGKLSVIKAIQAPLMLVKFSGC
jgi:hypothetical protein